MAAERAFNPKNRCQTILKKTAVACCVILAVCLCGCSEIKEGLFSGQTMGTTYHIKLIFQGSQNLSEIHAAIQKRLDEINKSMSTFLEESEISRFNALNQPGERIHISKDFYHVMQTARQLFEITQGAWDGTIYPLMTLWGFGLEETERSIPSSRKIEDILLQIGFDGLEITEDRFLIKRNPKVTLDLASIAKGYAVDSVSALIKTYGFRNFLVEIGGEVFASGRRRDGSVWKVGINTPLKESPQDQVYKVVSLTDRAMATSGDYRIFFEIDGKRYAHVLDPRTGYPVANGVVSVSVISDSCMLADGLATALMVMGPEKGLALINRLDDMECLIVVRTDDGRLIDIFSKKFG